MPLIDLAAVKQRIAMQDVLDFLQWKPTRKDRGGMHGPCPIHGSTRPRSSSFSVCEKGFTCHSCKRCGDHLRLLAEARNLSVYEAAIQLCRYKAVAIPWLVKRAQRGFPTKGTGKRRG